MDHQVGFVRGATKKHNGIPDFGPGGCVLEKIITLLVAFWFVAMPSPTTRWMIRKDVHLETFCLSPTISAFMISRMGIDIASATVGPSFFSIAFNSVCHAIFEPSAVVKVIAWH